MNTQFDEWLALLRRAEKGPAPFDPATRGRIWLQDITLPGDWITAEMRAQVRLYPDAPGEPLATCVVNGPYLVDGDTLFQLRLDGGSAPNSTGALPADGDGGGVVQLAIDVLLQADGGEEELLFGGLLELGGRVTA